MRANILAFCIACLTCAQVWAFAVDVQLHDPVKEARARALFQQIRCIVCEGESIADSPADVAADMRRDIRMRIDQGENDETIKTYLASRYGNVILMKPPLMPATWPLWFGPLAVLAAGLFLAKRCFRKS